MLRSAQMLMAQALQRHMLGREWRAPEDLEARRSVKEYCDILHWFTDYPGPPSVYSIHHLCQCGMRYDKLPGEWYGPSTAALVLRDLAKLHHRKYRGPIEVFVCQGDTIFVSEVDHYCTYAGLRKGTGQTTTRDAIASQLPDSPTTGDKGESWRPPREPRVRSNAALHVEEDSDEADDGREGRTDSGAFDPLLNPPPRSEVAPNWTCGLLLLMPLKLGVRVVNSEYYREVQDVLENKFSVGMLGGRPKHAIYFVGHRNGLLLGLDPHSTLPNTSLSEPFPSAEFMIQTQVSELQMLDMTLLDPSVSLAFYFRNREEFLSFCDMTRMQTDRKKEDGRRALYTVQQHKPSYVESDWAALGQSDGAASDEEDEYVFV